jgi:uncharacterized protein YecE (DUF72 family)
LYLDQVPPGGSHLERYARYLDAAEINSSFYRSHRRTTYQRWAQCVPDDFRFAVKVPKAITHEAGLADCGALLDRFVDEVTGLDDKLAVLLVQLPPKSALEKRVANRFFRDLRARIDTDIVLEPRHASWFAPDVDDWLAKRRIARVAADPARIAGAGEPGAAALAALKRRLEDNRSHASSVWCIFDNTASGAALGNALTLRQQHGLKQQKAKSK